MNKIGLIPLFVLFASGIAAAQNKHACQQGPTATCVVELAEDEMANLEQSPIADYRGGMYAFTYSLTKTQGHSYAATLVEKYLTSPVYKDIGNAAIAGSLYATGDLNTSMEFFSKTCLSSKERFALFKQLLNAGDFSSAISLIGCTYGSDRIKLQSTLLNHETDAPTAHPTWMIQGLVEDVPTLVSDLKPAELCWTFAALKNYLVTPKPLEATIPLANEIEDTDERESALKDLVECLTENGEFRSAITAASFLGDVDDEAKEMLHVSWAMAEAGDATGAERIVDKISRDDDDYFGKIWLVLLKLGKLKDAESAIELVEEDFRSSWPRRELALAFEKEGDLESAKRSAQSAARIALEKLSSDFPTTLSDVLLVKHLLEPDDIEILRPYAIELAKSESTTDYSYLALDLCGFLAGVNEASEALNLALNRLTEGDRFTCYSYIIDASEN
jgi:hypothetical protein